MRKYLFSTKNKKVAIIGGGSVGMTLSLFLSNNGIANSIYEKDSMLSLHPKAHYLSPRSCEILDQIGVYSILKASTEHNPISNWSFYRYCGSVLDKNSYLGEIDHFSYPDYCNYLLKISNTLPINISQHELNDILYKEIVKKDNINYHFNSHVKRITQNINEKITIDFYNEKESEDYDYLIGCDGPGSIVRKEIGSNLIGNNNIHSFININFYSKSLGLLMMAINKQSMLHFIFNEKQGITILINYDIVKGCYVLQVPFHKEFQKFEDYTKDKCREILNDIISLNTSTSCNDIEIISINQWTMRNVYADLYTNSINNMFILGDACHQFPPSGGFGLNQGISDVYSFAWRFVTLYKSNNNDSFETFNKERKNVSSFISNCASLNYSKFLSTCEAVNLKPEYADMLKKGINTLFGNMPVKSSLFNYLSGIGYTLSTYFKPKLIEHLKNKNNFISLVHPNVDYNINYLSNSNNKDLLFLYSYFELSNYKLVEEGKIISNIKYKNSENTLRHFISSKPLNSKFIIYNSHIKDNNLLPETNDYTTNYNIDITTLEHLEKYFEDQKIKFIIIRPDHVIEKIIYF